MRLIGRWWGEDMAKVVLLVVAVRLPDDASTDDADDLLTVTTDAAMEQSRKAYGDQAGVGGAYVWPDPILYGLSLADAAEAATMGAHE